MAYIRFGEDRPPGNKSEAVSPWKLAALTFFDPRFATTDGIINVLNLLDQFSGQNMDIFLHGYKKEAAQWLDVQDLVEIRVGTKKMYYDPKQLNVEVQRFESKSNWHFSFEVDVILVKQRLWYINDGGYERDLKNSIVLNLHRLLLDKKISSYAAFFGEIINFAKDYHGNNPAWDYSDHRAWTQLKESLFDAFKAYLGFRKFQIKIEDYAIRDISRKK
jgi:hypothetical protein